MAHVAFVQYGSGALVTALLHPFGYAKVLMQVGHEPLQPTVASAFITNKRFMCYPNIFKYMGHIKQTDGFMGLYRGVFPRVIAGTVGNLVQTNITEVIKANNEDTQARQESEKDLAEWLKQFAITTSEDTLARCCGVLVSHPFHVIMIRSMVQFIGRETKYNTVFSSVREIWEHDGILGFFSGLIPRLVGEVITIWMTAMFSQLLKKYLLEDHAEMNDYTGAACGPIKRRYLKFIQVKNERKKPNKMESAKLKYMQLVVSNFTYPFTLVANIMAVTNSGLEAGSPPHMQHYTGWLECYSHLSQLGDTKRGAASFRRAVPLSIVGSAGLMRY